MSLKLHFHNPPLNFISENMGDINEEHNERFHQDIIFINYGMKIPREMGL